MAGAALAVLAGAALAVLAGAAFAVLAGAAVAVLSADPVVTRRDGEVAADRPAGVVRPAVLVAGVLVAAMAYRPLPG
jgi:hypothetical protein